MTDEDRPSEAKGQRRTAQLARGDRPLCAGRLRARRQSGLLCEALGTVERLVSVLLLDTPIQLRRWYCWRHDPERREHEDRTPC